MIERFPREFEIAGVRVGNDRPCYFIAEIGLNHNGSLDSAKKLIDCAVAAGASAVKFQKRTVDVLAVASVLDAKDGRFPDFGQTYRQIRDHHEFDAAGYGELLRYSARRGIPFICTPFDIPAVDFLERFDLAAYKVASHSVSNLPLLDRVGATGRPVIMSTGMCTWDELDAAVDVMARHNASLALLHCVSSYPQPDEESELGLIAALRDRYSVPVGYSGHELGSLPTLAAVALGAVVVERHITLDSTLIGFDHKLSVEPDDLIRLVADIRRLESMKGSGEKRVTDQEMRTRLKYHVSIVSTRDIDMGVVVSQDMLTLKNPGTGLPASAMADVVGRRARARIPADSLLEWELLE
jgi:sialic acid synthase SpsE